ncbi:MAG: UvrD-helicase domain-containing protein [Magnetococcales bacterium]|nr:UvrD-helicase domain-containing protein [Magnetococcales bacterium]
MSEPADGEVRRRVLDPEGSFLVRAPAGSGKTGLLTQRFLTLLPRVNHPEEVVAITFTRKASREMRSRILQALRQAAAGSHPSPTDAHALRLHQLALAVLEADSRRNWGLADHPGRLRILTIDALGAMVARQSPVAGGLGAAPDMSAQPEALYREAARRTLLHARWHRDWNPFLATFLSHLDLRTSRAIDLLVGALGRREQWMRLGVMADEHLREALQSAWSQLARSRLDRFLDHLPPDWPCRLGALIDYAAALQPALRDWQPDGPTLEASLTRWRLAAELLLTQAGTVRRQVTVKEGFPAPSSSRNADEKALFTRRKEEMKGFLEELAEQPERVASLLQLRELPPVAFTEAQWETLSALLPLLKMAVAQLQRLFAEQGEIDFPALALAAVQALGEPDAPTDLALQWDYRIRHLLVDEFQDTSRLQWELLERLIAGWTPGEGRSLFLVGDPMQSIYRFRQAEVALFRLAAERGVGDMPLEVADLSVNFRSEPGLVNWVNTLFACETEESVSGVAYVAALSSREGGDGGEVSVWPVADEAMQARWVVSLVSGLLRRYPLDSLGILVRARTHLSAVLPALQAAGVAFSAPDLHPLESRPVVRDLYSLAAALLHPGDSLHWNALLRAAPCGVSLADLVVLNEARRESTVFELLRRFESLTALSSEGKERLSRIVPVLSVAVAESRGHLSRLAVERCWLALGGGATLTGPEEWSEASRFLELLSALEEEGIAVDGTVMAERVGFLFARSEAAGEVEAPRLQIMTIHKAKGLEFDRVILPGLHRTPRREESSLLAWSHDPELEPGPSLLMAPISGRRQKEPDPHFDYLNRLERKQAREEAARLLYVALTRARKALHLLAVTPEVKADGTFSPGPGTFLKALWPQVEEPFVRAAQSGTFPQPPEQEERIPSGVDGERGRLPALWTRPPMPSALRVSGRPAAGMVPVDIPFEWAGQTIRCLGQVVHRLMLLVAREPLSRWTPSRVESMGPAIRRQLLGLGVPLDEVDAALSRAMEAMRVTLRDERGRWILDSRHREARSEWELAGMDRGEMVQVAIDRSFVDSDGQRWIVDFKTGYHKGERESFLDQELERYRGQLARYARLLTAMTGEPVMTGLYFPLLAGWRAWDPGMVGR